MSVLYCLNRQIPTQLNTYEICWTSVPDTTLHHHHQNTKCENIVLVAFQKLGESMPRSIFAASTARGAQHLAETVYASFLFNSSPVCLLLYE